jgi:hypothetical protein
MKVARMAANSVERTVARMDTTTAEKRAVATADAKAARKDERMADKRDDAKVGLLRRRRVKEGNGNKV